MRTLRNLKPRNDAESWIPAGTTLNATTRIAGLYHRHCGGGTRTELAHALVMADVNAAIVHGDPGGNVAVGAAVPLPGVAATMATAKPARAQSKSRQAHSYRVVKGDTLGRIAQRHGCDVKSLARANGLKAPAYGVRQGQQLKLEGCGG
jgi:membrane-bound lytic murein transglycosylase D